MFVCSTVPYECSNCKGQIVEHVTHDNAKFIRCLKCGHEGNKSNIVPGAAREQSGQIKYTNCGPYKF